MRPGQPGWMGCVKQMNSNAASDEAMLEALRQWAACQLGAQSPTALPMQDAMLNLMRQWASQCDFIFVGGVARSGTTYIKDVLNAHSRICCGHELKLVPLMCSIRKHWWKTMDHQLVPAGLTEPKMDDTFRSFAAMYMLLSRLDNKPRIAEKTPHNVTEFATLHSWFPRAKFVHVVRDGRAVMASLLKQNWTDMTDPTGAKVWYCRDATGAARYWRHILETAAAEQARIAPSQYHTVKYEDLVAQPETTMRGLFHFLGEPWEPAVLQQQPVQADSLERWRGELTEAQLQEFYAMSGELLTSMGYTK